jgi:type IV pilus assembly protein PilA
MSDHGTTTAIALVRTNGMPLHFMHRPTATATSSTTGRTRAFTLVELMAAVAIVGILAALAVVGYKRYINTSQSGEALSVISGIRVAEESYKAETLTYLGCSGCGGAGCAPGAGSLNATYPMATPNSHKWAWTNAGHGDYQCWRTLNVVTDGPVRFGYAVIAGNPGQMPATITTTNPNITFPANTSDNPWYVIQAKGDRDNNSIFAYFVGTSMTGEIFRQSESE